MLITFHPDYLLHNKGNGHPERPERLESVLTLLKKEGIWDKLTIVTPEKADEKDILLCHTRELLALVKAFSKGGGQLDADTPVQVGTYDIALLSIQGTKDAFLHSLKTKEASFALVRPPGHHAETDRSCGFCYFNNAAIAAQCAINEQKAKKVLILDIDVHHGNGTQEIFYESDDVFYLSLHQDPHTLYPGVGFIYQTGNGKGKGYNANVPLPPGTSDANYIYAFKESLTHIIDLFSPDGIIVSVGFDTHKHDPLAALNLSKNAYTAVAQILKDTGLPISFTLEGGYDTGVMAKGVKAIVNVFLEDKNEKINVETPDAATVSLVNSVKDALIDDSL